MNEIYNAILKAADQIALHPESFDFFSIDTPNNDCGTPGCALGWIGTFLPRDMLTRRGNAYLDQIGFAILPESTIDPDYDFYVRMNRLCGVEEIGRDWGPWSQDAQTCANTLRLYAAKYHAPAAKPRIGLPDIVREIFQQPAMATNR